MNIIKITIFLVMTVFLFLNTACSEQEKTSKTTVEDVKKEALEAVETAGSYTMEQRQAYQRQLADKLVEYDRDIATLKQQLAMVKATAGQKTQEKIDMLQAKVEDMKKRTEELKNASGEAWKEIRRGLEKAGNDLERSISDAMKNFE